MQLSIQSDFKFLVKSLSDLHNDIAVRAATDAVNKTLDQAKTQMARSITQEFNVTQAYVKPRLKITYATARANANGISGLLRGSGKRAGGRSANIIAFVEKKTTLATGRRRKKEGTQTQLFVKVKRSGPYISLGPKAFIGNKGRTVFEREGKARLPIKPISTVDVPSMFNTKRVNNIVIKLMKDKFPEIFGRQVKFFTDRFNKGQ